MSDFKLGKKVVPTPKPKEDVIEATDRPGVYRVNGKLETWVPENELANLPVIDPYQHMLDILRKQEDDGFPAAFWGVL